MSVYSPAPPASQCLNGQLQTQDAFDYASIHVTFLSFNLADAGVFIGNLPSGGSAWFSLPGAITASDITLVTPEPASLWLLAVAICGLGLTRGRRA